jgi:hypothetical protein
MLKELLFFDDAIPITICSAYPINSKNATITSSFYILSAEKLFLYFSINDKKNPEA